MVATVKIDIRLARQAVIDNDIEPIGGADRRHCPQLATKKQHLDLLLTGHIHVAAKQPTELFTLNMPGDWNKQRPALIFNCNHDICM